MPEPTRVKHSPTWLLLFVGFVALSIQAVGAGIEIGPVRVERSPLLAGIAALILLGYLALTEPDTLRMVGTIRFWVTGLILAGLSGLVLGSRRVDVFGVPVSIDGLNAGLIVVLRAAILISLLMALSKRIQADWLVRLFARVGLPQAGGAFALGVRLLPRMVERWKAELAAGRHGVVDRLARLVAAGADLADEIARDLDVWLSDRRRARLFLVSGAVGGGKTSLLNEIIAQAEAKGFRVGGFTQPARHNGDTRSGYDLRFLPGETRQPLARPSRSGERPWDFDDSAFEAARTHLESLDAAQLWVVDEIGRLERDGGGHWPVVARCVPQRGGVWVMAVRRGMEASTAARLGYGDTQILTDPGDAARRQAFVAAVLDALEAERAGV